MVWLVIYLMLGFIIAVQTSVELEKASRGRDRVGHGDFLRITAAWPIFIVALLWSVWNR